MNATDFINALNDGKTLIDSEHETILYQIDDKITTQTPCVLTHTPKITSWAITENDNAEMFDSRGKSLMIIRTRYFEVKE